METKYIFQASEEEIDIIFSLFVNQLEDTVCKLWILKAFKYFILKNIQKSNNLSKKDKEEYIVFISRILLKFDAITKKKEELDLIFAKLVTFFIKLFSKKS